MKKIESAQSRKSWCGEGKTLFFRAQSCLPRENPWGQNISVCSGRDEEEEEGENISVCVCGCCCLVPQPSGLEWCQLKKWARSFSLSLCSYLFYSKLTYISLCFSFCACVRVREKKRDPSIKPWRGLPLSSERDRERKPGTPTLDCCSNLLELSWQLWKWARYRTDGDVCLCPCLLCWGWTHSTDLLAPLNHLHSLSLSGVSARVFPLDSLEPGFVVLVQKVCMLI